MCGLPAALSLIVTVPVRVPVTVGVNLTLILHLAFTASDEGHVVASEKSPLMAMLLIFSDAVPPLVSVTVCAALVVPPLRKTKVKLLGESFAMGATPVPVRLTVCGLPVASSVTVIVPGLLPVAVGVNVTLMEHFAPAATEAPQVLVSAYGALAAMLVMVSAAVPPLVSVTVRAALVVFTF